jgi:hypothetical protein
MVGKVERTAERTASRSVGDNPLWERAARSWSSLRTASWR